MSKIMVVDDNKLFCDTLAELLEFAGHVVTRASGGENAIEQLAGELPDLVLLDLFMREMNGIETLTAIRADPRTGRVPVVIISALGEEEEMKRAMAAGANDFWIKTNFDFDELQHRLERYGCSASAASSKGAVADAHRHDPPGATASI